jgi:hypothetical protein
MRDVTPPRTVRRVRFQGATYSLKEISALLVNIYWADYRSQVAFAAIATAAFTGLRLAELRACNGVTFKISVYLWSGRCGEPSKAFQIRSRARTLCPCSLGSNLSLRTVANLEGAVDDEGRGKTLRPTDWMFTGERRGGLMNLPNLVCRTIIPNLPRLEVCNSTSIATRVRTTLSNSMNRLRRGRVGIASGVRWLQIFIASV